MSESDKVLCEGQCMGRLHRTLISEQGLTIYDIRSPSEI